MDSKRLLRRKAINPADYTNNKTGEPLDSEFPTARSINVTDEDLIILDYKNYIIINEKAMRFIANNFSQVEIGRIYTMAGMVKGSWNILHQQKGSPHSDDTLMEDIKYTRNKYHDFMKKLLKMGVIYYST